MNYYDYFISKTDIENIHEISLKILEEVGIKFEDLRALEALKKKGAKIDGDIAYINRELLGDSLSSVPNQFVLKSKGQETVVGHSSMVKLPWGLAVLTNDGGQVRKLTNEDMVRFFKLQDTSPIIDAHINFNFYNTENWTDKQKKFGHTAYALKYANKPTYVSGEYHDIEDFYKCIELIKNFNGLMDSYITIMRMNPESPLTFDNMGLQFILAAADKNQPIMVAPCAMAALTAPPTIAGLLALTNAEILGGLVLSQALRPGLPFLYGNTSTSADLRTVQPSMGAPETALITYATVALGNYYDIPCRTSGALNDAKDVDWQAGAESTLLMTAAVLAGADLVFHTCGLMGSMNIASYEKFILDEENYMACERLKKGIDFSPEKFSFDIIKRVGQRGTYLLETKSKLFHQEFCRFQQYDKDAINAWVDKGSISIKEKARIKAEERIENYLFPEITVEQEKLLMDYLPTKYLTNA